MEGWKWQGHACQAMAWREKDAAGISITRNLVSFLVFTSDSQERVEHVLDICTGTDSGKWNLDKVKFILLVYYF